VTVESVALQDFRHLLWVRLDHPLGPLDVFTTHLASSGDGAQNPCAADCPPECVAAGAATVRQCQAVQVGEIVAARHDVPTPAVVTGDFNDDPGTFAYAQLVGRGWSTRISPRESGVQSGHGVGCTSGGTT
jgi:endonuclease/exonuclease/phosphatase family metal-dependent hydrolase